MPDPLQRLRTCFGQDDDPGTGRLPSKPGFDYAVDRFRLAYQQGSLGPDQVILLRQAIRWCGMPQISIQKPADTPEEFDSWLQKAGVSWAPHGALSATPYQPDWLENGLEPIDNVPQRRGPDPSEEFPGEPYLKQNLNFEDWLSPAQKEAVWFTLTAPPGSTRTIVLPTGCGKSSSFWILPTFDTGLTVVIVPTVALAMDQYQSAMERFKNLPAEANPNPIFFSADGTRDTVVAKLKDKQCRLVFASPETCVSGVLRRILDGFAREGWFQNLVVDEAHLIETWGAEFRVEFQLLGAMREQWKESNQKLRTFLFSATMSQQCRETLGSLFSDEEGEHQEYVCQRLRPEMSYYSQKFDEDEDRWPRLKEALWHLPRPAILYTTEPPKARAIYDRLREEGFNRIGCFTGETNRRNRQEQLDAWRGNEIDLMVATSAFGVGMDKADVRTIIHACYPENLDRYYQEVGRSGRDEHSSICLFMPIQDDKDTAGSLRVTLLKAKKIQERWKALFAAHKKVEAQNPTYKLPVEAKGTSKLGARTYSEHIKWNKRLLLMLHRAKRIQLKNIYLEQHDNPNEESEEWIEVEFLNFAPHSPHVGRDLLIQRDEELRYFNSGFNKVDELLEPKKCIARSFQEIYGVSRRQFVCGGCRYCRKKKISRSECNPLQIPKLNIEEARGGTIVEGFPSPIEEAQQDQFIDNLDRCLDRHSLKPFRFYCPEEHFDQILDVFKEGEILTPNRGFYRIDPFTSTTVLRHAPEDPVLFCHIGEYSEGMLKTGKTCRSIHLFCSIQNPTEANGRHIGTKYDCDVWPTPKAWLGGLN